MCLAADPPKRLAPKVFVNSAQPERGESSSRPEEGERCWTPRGQLSYTWRRGFFQSSSLSKTPSPLLNSLP